MGLGVWKPQKYFTQIGPLSLQHWAPMDRFESVLEPLAQELFVITSKLSYLGLKQSHKINSNSESEIFLWLPDTQSQYRFFQPAKFKRALLYSIFVVDNRHAN